MENTPNVSPDEETCGKQEQELDFDKKMRGRWQQSRNIWEKEERERKERKDLAARLTGKWELARECTKYIRENSESWKERTFQETKRIKEEEKRLRLEVASRKKSKFELGNLKSFFFSCFNLGTNFSHFLATKI